MSRVDASPSEFCRNESILSRNYDCLKSMVPLFKKCIANEPLLSWIYGCPKSMLFFTNATNSEPIQNQCFSLRIQLKPNQFKEKSMTVQTNSESMLFFKTYKKKSHSCPGGVTIQNQCS